MPKGYKHTEETKKRISEARKLKMVTLGYINSPETRKRMGIAQIGRKHTKEARQKMSESNKGKHHSEETKKKISETHKGKPKTEEHKKKISEFVKKNSIRYWLGKKRPPVREETRKKISESQKVKREKHPNWKGGITPINKKIRNSLEYKLWREAVFKRDDWTCVWCKIRGGTLNADHIKPFCDYPELRFAIDNGRTLCRECHRKTDTYGWHKKITAN